MIATPAMAEAMTSAITGRTPIAPPTLMNSAISTIGRITKDNSSHMKVYPPARSISGAKLDLGRVAPYISILNRRYKDR